MDWTEEMKIAMKLMKDACKRRTRCCICPFAEYCDILEGEKYSAEMLPFNFFRTEREE